jgi:FMN-binding domain
MVRTPHPALPKITMEIIMKSMGRGARLLFFLVLMGPISQSFAKIFYSKDEAMSLAFGKGKKVEMLSLFPDDSQAAKIQELAKTKLESGLFTFYVGKDQGKILGYAAIEAITVRTKPETLMIVLTPEGELRNVYTLAFHEPPEYQPPERWYEKLYQRPLIEMDFNKGVDGISGATLSTRAAIASIRKVMAIYQVLIKEKGKP